MSILCVAGSSYAAEVSLFDVGIKSNERKFGDAEVDVLTLQGGGRYLEYFDQETAAFYYGALVISTYDGENSPSDNLGITIGAGQRYYGRPFSPAIVPYVAGFAEFESFETFEDSGSTVETTGINYGAGLGMRFDLFEEVFFELESEVFKASLMSTEKVKSADDETTYEESKFEIFASSTQPFLFSSFMVSVGMKIH